MATWKNIFIEKKKECRRHYGGKCFALFCTQAITAEGIYIKRKKLKGKK